MYWWTGDPTDPDRVRDRWWGRVRWFALLAVVTFVQVVGTTGAAFRQPEARPLDWLAYVLLLAGPVALLLVGPVPLLRRFRPGAPFLVAFVALLGYLVGGYPFGPIPLAFAVSLVVAVVAGRRVLVWITLGAGLLGYYAFRFLVGPPPAFSTVAGHVAWSIVVVAVAEAIRIRRVRTLEQRRMADEARRRRASEERLVIAQELHDVLAHNISLINVQAGVGLHLMDAKPEQARSALTAIKAASAEALGELRSVLDVLRAGEAPRSPAPGMDALPGLVERTGAAGVAVSLATTGSARPLPAQVELTAYRLVQEALTNVVKHAGARNADVRVDYGADVLDLTVTDDGRGTGADPGAPGTPAAAASALPGTGSGIAGMRRRVTALGGTVEAAPVPGGGFRVHARVPLAPAPAAPAAPAAPRPAPAGDPENRPEART